MRLKQMIFVEIVIEMSAYPPIRSSCLCSSRKSSTSVMSVLRQPDFRFIETCFFFAPFDMISRSVVALIQTYFTLHFKRLKKYFK